MRASEDAERLAAMARQKQAEDVARQEAAKAEQERIAEAEADRIRAV